MAFTRRVPPYRQGQRVQLHPGTDRWMMGDRYGIVIKMGRRLVHVKLDVSGQTRKFHPSNILGEA